jgi:hypothetical protein
MPSQHAAGGGGTDRLPKRRRFVLLTLASAAGGLALIPFQAGAAPAGQLAAFAVVSIALAAAASWSGLVWADRIGLPLPLLRAWERRQPVRVDRHALLLSVALGLALGILGLAVLRHVGLSGGSGSLAARAVSTLFAAVTLEVIVHLGLMSGLAVLLRGRVGAANVLSAAIFVAFHLSGMQEQPLDVTLLSVAVNGLGALSFGWLYAARGFEYLVLAHAVAHIMTVVVGGG